MHCQWKITYDQPHFVSIKLEHLVKDGVHGCTRRTLEIRKFHDRDRCIRVTSNRVVIYADRLDGWFRLRDKQTEVRSLSQPIRELLFQPLPILILQVGDNLITNCGQLCFEPTFIVTIKLCDLRLSWLLYLLCY